jgi:phospholipid/cholesterol/gamma-HCH transport system substrate-binding protein
METRANYALIGAFTVAVVLAAFGFVYWFSGPSQTAQYKIYEIVVRGSVDGLLRGAAVQFNGLKVGEVTQLRVGADDPSRVDVLVSIEKTTPVKTNTRARLEQKGLTGLAVVSLVGGTPGAQDLVALEGQQFPRIQAEHSELQNLVDNVQTLTKRADEVLGKLDRVIDENGPALTASLKNVETFTKALADNANPLGSLVRDAADVAHSLKPAANRLDRVLAAGEQTIKALDPKKLKAITGDMAGGFSNLHKFSATGLRQYEQLAVDARKAVDSLDRAVRSLERDPSQVIFGPTPAAPEVQGR